VQSAATGDITAVTAGNGLTGGAASGSATLNLDESYFDKTAGGTGLAANFEPSANNTYSLGSLTNVWKDVYVGPGSLYVNGQQVLSDSSGTIQVSADTNQNISIVTTGTGDIEFTSGGEIQLKSNVVLSSGKVITTAGGEATKFTSNVNMNSNNVNNVADPVAAQDAATKAYVDAQVDTADALSELSGDTDDITEGSTNLFFTNARADARVAAAGDLVRTTGNQSIAGDKTFSGSTTFSGTLAATGSALTIADNLIELNSGTSGSPTENVGIIVDRGDSTDVQLRWNETDDNWEFTNDGATYYVIPELIDEDNMASDSASKVPTQQSVKAYVDSQVAGKDALSELSGDTDDVSEGSTNLYFTNARADARIAAATTDDLSEGSSNLYYTTARWDTKMAAADTDDLSEGASNLYFTNARADARIAAASTDDLAEGTNLYYTDARSRAAVSVTDAGGDGSLAYNSSTGVITYTGPSAAEVRAHFSASTGIDITDGAISTTITQYADSDARGAISVTDAGGDGSLAYNGSTGVITYTGPSAAEVRAHFSAGTGVTYSGGAFSIGQAVATSSNVEFNDLLVQGSLTVNGSTTTVSSTNTTIEDALIELGSGNTGANSNDLGLILERGSTGDNAFMGWDESADKFLMGTTTATGSSTGSLTVTTGTLVANLEGDVTGDVTGTVSSIANHDTGDLSEGSNLYYTNARADARIALQVGSNLDLSNKDTDDLSEGSSNLYFTNARADARIAAASTTDLSEGSNLYHTTERVQDIVGGQLVTNGSHTGISFSYDDAGDGAVDATVSLAGFSTSNLSEGSNLYFTNARADARVNAVLPDTGSLSEGSNLYFTNARADARIANNIIDEDTLVSDSATRAPSQQSVKAYVDAQVASKDALSELSGDSDDVTEGSSNLYFTNARARSAISVSGDLSYNSSTGVISFTNDAGDIESVGAGNGLTGGGTSGAVTLNVGAGALIDVAADTVSVDLSELTDMTAAVDGGADELVLLDSGVQRRKLISEITLSDFNNDLGNYGGWTSNVGDITAVTAGTGLSGGGSSGGVTLNVSGLTVSEFAGGSIQTGSESFSDSDSVLMTAAAVQDKILSYGYTTNVGDITGITAGNGLTGGGSSGTPTIHVGAGALIDVSADAVAVDLSELTDMTAAMAGTDEFVVLDAGAQRRKAANEIGLSVFSNDSGFTTNVGDITNVAVSGTGLSGGGSSGAVTISSNATSANTASTIVARDGSGNFSAGVITATATAARYADLAERYLADADIEPGTVVCFGGEAEVTACNQESHHAVAGVVSTDPAYLMNAEADGVAVALCGRVPCKVSGPVAKGDLLVSSNIAGHAKSDNNAGPGRIIGKAIGSSEGGEAVIEVLVNLM
jgi:hypothetical protein